MHRAVLHAVMVSALSTVAHAQMSSERLQDAKIQLAKERSLTAIEAEFTERVGASVRSGHAIFSNIGFVLAYTIPAGRRVISDSSTTRIDDPAARHFITRWHASDGPYAALLGLTATARLDFVSGYEDAAHGMMRLTGTVGVETGTFFVDSVAWEIVRIRSSTLDIELSHVHPMAHARAIAIVRTALAP